MTPGEFLGDSHLGRAVFDAVRDQVMGLGDVEVRATKSQIAFKRRRGFAYLWLPGMYLANPRAEIVLSIATDQKWESPRWKEVSHPTAAIWQHHLEIIDLSDIDDEVRGWLQAAYDSAG
jgi:predicted transport protein